MFPVRLLKNYAPRGAYEIVGYDKPEIRRKTSDGRMVIEQAGEFIQGEMHPAVFAGTGFPNKIWADTIINLPRDEAYGLIETNRAKRADDLPA
jgi:hypothetical protein